MQHLLTTLHHSDPQRLAKAAQGLADGTLTVTIVSQGSTEVRALVVNGDGIEYTAVITAHDALCGCKDWLYRGRKVGPCKHLAAVALYTIQHPDAGVAQEQSVIHLCRPDDVPFCGRGKTSKSWSWAMWPAYQDALTFEQVCETCVEIVWPQKVALNGAGTTVQSQAAA